MDTGRLWSIVFLCCCSVSLALVTSGTAQQLVLVDFTTSSQAVPEGWELLENSGKAKLALVPDGSGRVLQLQSEETSFALQKKVDIPVQATPFLVWQWKVTQLPTGGDFRQSRTDDQAAQLILAFSERHFLAYLWDSTAPQGTLSEAPAPLFRKIFAVVMQSGPRALNTWITERRNVLEDYTKAYGEAPEAIQGVRIQINSQHTNSRAEAYWKSIVLTKQP